jgi:glycerophosphoryl diester phosphodiesterase
MRKPKSTCINGTEIWLHVRYKNERGYSMRMWMFILILFGFEFGFYSRGFSVENINSPMLNIAHRGASGYAPENTFAAFDKAVEMDADYIEFDVQMSKDKHVVIIHDPKVNRTTNGKGYVKDKSLKELKKLDAGSWYSSEFRFEKIPTFVEVLKRYRGKIGLLIEIKRPTLYPGIEEQIAKDIKQHYIGHAPIDRLKIQSFSAAAIKRFHNHMPNIDIGITLRHFLSKKQIITFASNVDFINVHEKYITKALISNAHTYGLKILAWSVHDVKTAKNLLRKEIDGMLVNFPEFAYRTHYE